MKKSIRTSLGAHLLHLLMACATIAGAQAQSTGTARTLYTNLGDGSAYFRVDEFGQFTRPGYGRVVFDPLGPFGPQQTDFVTALYLFDTVSLLRTPITDNYWHDFNNCPHGVEPRPSAVANVTFDQTVGTHTRITRFTLPAFPELEVELTQVAAGEKLVQTYAFTNITNNTLNLTLARTSDIDIQYTAPYWENYGGEYPIGSSNPYGAVILDRGLGAGMVITAPAGSDAIFQGWRIQAMSTGGYMHTAVWGNYGFSPSQYNGVASDGLNGFWSNPGVWNVDGRCGVTGTDLPLAANYASYMALHPPSDMAATIQSSLVIPGGATRTYITETFGIPGANPCQSATCGTISGNVQVDAGGCTGGTAMSNQIVVATNVATLDRYYAATNAAGNYMVNAPYGVYQVELANSGSQSCPTANPTYTLSAALPSVVKVNILAKASCDVDLFITSHNPSTVVPNGCGIPYRRPCPGSPWRYCFNVFNSGNLPIPANTGFDYGFSAGTIIPSPVGQAGCWQQLNNNHSFLQNDLLPGASCGFCVDVLIPLGTTSPHVTRFETAGNAACGQGNQHPLRDSDLLREELSCSCDPNQKSAYPMGCGPNHVIGLEDITYTIEFDNIGTTPAGRVVVVDQLDTDLDLSTFRVLQTSHSLTDVRIHPASGVPGQYEVHFILNNINLAPVLLDPTAVGRIVYRISPKAGLLDGSVIENLATIYFDANPPIQTNTVFHTFVADPSPIVSFGGPYTAYLGYGPSCATLTPTVTGGMPPYTYTWGHGKTTASVQVCPTSDSVFVVTVTDANGCESMAEVPVAFQDVRCGNKLTKVRVCQRGNEICINSSVVPAYLASGATLGPCPSSKTADSAAKNESGLVIWPNPANGQTSLEWVAKADGPMQVTLYAMDGRQVFAKTVDEGQAGSAIKTEIDLNGLEDGVYIVRIVDANGHVGAQKFIITH